MKAIIPLLMLFFMSCGCIQYVSDVGIMSSAAANSPEFMIKINGKVCKNGSGEIGLCIEKAKRGADIVLHIDPLPYNYQVDQDCTDAISSDESFTIQANEPFDGTLKHGNFDSQTVFNCTYTVTPLDRKISMFAAMRIFVVSDKYEPLESIYKNSQGKLVLGEHAHITITEDKVYYNVTTINSKNSAIVESEAGRRSYYGIE